jgi:hypothetical protein
VHAAVVVLSSLFSFFAVFGVVGLLMSILLYRMFRQVSLYLRGLLIACLVGVLSTSFAVPSLVEHLPQSPVRFLPSVWFLGLCQMLRGRASPALAILGNLGLIQLDLSCELCACRLRRQLSQMLQPHSRKLGCNCFKRAVYGSTDFRFTGSHRAAHSGATCGLSICPENIVP